ncbi:MAG: lipoyl(octanoyl) transferase LipB [Acidobacteria bacterium]|nr:lipoyl(octanoyl) transferase LipB [Acidobacteriota bacterium]
MRLGRIDYESALDLQLRLCEAKKRGMEPDVLLLLEHPPVITLGRNGNWHNLVVPDEVLQARGVARFETDRGGDITFHGPGQLVGYPILRLEPGERDVHLYMRRLEECLIRMLAAYGIRAYRDPRYTGVWTGDGKIAAMGVHLSRWVTRHGFALNVNTDLSYYDLIIPCGIAGKGVTSMCRVLARPIELGDVAVRAALEFAVLFGRRLEWRAAEELHAELAGRWEDGWSGKNRPASLQAR